VLKFPLPKSLLTHDRLDFLQWLRKDGVQKAVRLFAKRFFPIPTVALFCSRVPKSKAVVPIIDKDRVTCQIQQLRLPVHHFFGPLALGDVLGGAP
jgi:hypothetical protein